MLFTLSDSVDVERARKRLLVLEADDDNALDEHTAVPLIVERATAAVV